MALEQRLLDILVCPQDHGDLEYLEDKQVLVNPRLNIAYPIEDGIPVLLAEEALDWTDTSVTTQSGDTDNERTAK